MGAFTPGWGIGIGAPGLAGEPSRHRTTPEDCGLGFHPPATFNPWHDMTWCLCGAKTYPGNVATHAACCDGPLTELLNKGKV